MSERKYNENAAALNWNIVNGSEDIGLWKLWYEGKLIEGTGFIEFFNAAQSISEDINAIFVKRLKWFIHLAKNFITFVGRQFFANGDKEFYFIEIADNIELRNWDNFWKKVEDGGDFLKRLDICRTFLNHGEGGNLNKNKASLKNHYKYTLAKEMWRDEINKYYLYSDTANFCNELLPQTEDELYFMEQLDKAGFYYSNSDYRMKRVANVHCYDISSAFLSFLLKEKFPYSSFKEATTGEEVQKVIKGKFHCYYGMFRFHRLKYKLNFPVDLRRFGRPVDHEINSWELILTNVDMAWFQKVFSWERCEPMYFYYAEQKELSIKNYRKMFIDLYQTKDSQKKGTFAKEIAKFRAELPFGQPIKAVSYCGKTIYDEKSNDFIIVKNEEKSFEQIKIDLLKRKMPMYVGLWVAAYARKEFFSVLNAIGLENVVYGDTDSVKFIGEEGIKVIEEHNKETLKQLRALDKKYSTATNPKIGQWIDEGTVDAFKGIANKWYITMTNGEIDVKAAGANPEIIKNHLKTKKNPISEFNMYMKIDEMRLTISTKGKTVCLEYNNKIDEDFKKELCNKKFTALYNFNPYEEKEVI